MAEKNDRLLSDLDDSAGIECDACGIEFHDGQSYEKHMQGKKHQKKVTEAKLMARDLAAAKKIETKDDDEGESTSDDDREMHCEVCDKYFSGYIPYATHMKSGSHAKNAKKQKLKEQLGGMPDVLGQDDEGGDSDDDGIMPKPFARCKICEKEFSGPESYKKHLNSAVHKKKEKQQKLLLKLKVDSHQDDEAKKSDDEEMFSKCHVCDKSFSGVVPYQMHMKSNVHKKSVEKKKVAEEMKEFWVDDETDPGYVCKECKKVFSDPSAFKCHLANNSHEKQKAKAALMDFLNAHPEIVFASPLDENNSEAETSDSDSSDYYLICKLCHYSFSGPEAAKDHVKSKKHLSLKKERKIQKLLKERGKKGDDKKSADKNSKNGNSVKDSQANGEQKNPADKNHDDFEMI